MALAKRRLERNGSELDGAVTLSNPIDEERKLIIGLTGTHRPPGVKSLKIPLSALDAGIFAEYDVSLVAALALLHGPLRNRPAERSDEEHARADALADARRRGGAARPRVLVRQLV